MRRTRLRWQTAAVTTMAALTLASLAPTAASATPTAARTAPAKGSDSLPAGVQAACAAPAAPGQAACAALTLSGTSGGSGPLATTPAGFGPSDLQAAYGLQSASAGTRQTVAVVDAYDDPNAESDLGIYRSQYGLAPCTSADGCFKKIDENGGTSYPAPDPSWAVQISQDLDIVSATCPNCHVPLVEASSPGITDLGTAVDQAVTQGAKFVVNSYYGQETATETTWDSYYNHPGVAITAAAGDSGYQGVVNYPAASPSSPRSAAPPLPRPEPARAAGPRPPGAARAPDAQPMNPNRPGSTTPAARCAP
jgi:hypothetical protein